MAAPGALACAPMRVSAIVPTHDRPERLRTCLESLRAQTIDPALLEVIVVDDGSTGDIASVVSAAAAAGPIAMRCERQPLGGLNSARNRGARIAEGDVLAFLDDDTIVAEAWAETIRTAFDDDGCDAVGGRVELGLEGPPPPWLAARSYYLAEYDLGAQPRWIDETDPLPVGANCAVSRQAFDRVDGFRVGLDRIGASLVSNGDTEFFHRLKTTGARLRYEPRACVVHCVPGDRLSVEFFIRRHYAQGVSDELMLGMRTTASAWRRRAIHLRWLFGQLPRATRALYADLTQGRGTMIARFELSYWAGRLRGAGMSVPDEPGGTELTPGAAGPPSRRSPP
jgi:glucosyl-dolichyl phosphate glucuronosyltransferase